MMGAGLRPYPRMKDSGLEWLGEVPEHWDVRSLGQTGSFFKGRGGTKVDEITDGVPCVRYGDLYTRHRFFVTDTRACVSPQAAEKYTPIQYGDVLFAGSGETLGEIGKSAVNLLSDRTCVGGDVIVFRPSIVAHARFLGYAADCPAAISQKARSGRGLTVMHIYAIDLKYLSIAMPPLSEQRAIARFLDHAERRIQCCIRAKERLIKLLEEQKQAIIHRAVTGQIDIRTGHPYPTYRDSGVGGLEEMPEHWEVVALRHLATKFGSGVTPRGGGAVYETTGIPLLRSQNVHFDGLRLDGVARIPRDVHLALNGTDVHPGDVLLNITGASIGRVCTVPGNLRDANVNQHVCIIRTRPERISAEFLAAFISTPGMQKTIEVEQIGASRQGLTLDAIRRFKLFVPPAREQSVIMEAVGNAWDRFLLLASATKRQIALLEEYRTRLIADVVTGKVDVREAAANLRDADPIRDGKRDDTYHAERNSSATKTA